MNKKVLRLFLIPLVITVIYFVAQAFFLFNQFGVFSIVEEIPVNFKKTNQRDINLLKNQKVNATFKASEDNLGILFLRFVKFGQGSDTIVFKIKREGEEKWYHESKFSGVQIKNNEDFPLGFALITNSRNNTYVFELESLAGEYKNGVGVIENEQISVLYKYSAGELINYRTITHFAYKKSLYALKNINYWLLAGIFVVSFFFSLFIKKKKITATKTIRFLLIIKNDPRQALKMTINEIKSSYLFVEKKLVRSFSSTKFYLLFLNTNTKKRMAIGLLIFLLALTYRFSSTLVNQHLFFYAGLGGQGDYDQFIRVATCAVRNFCSGILGQNFLIETSILGIFYEIFGFTGALKAYLYLMLILSSIVATLPHFLLSRKTWITLGGILGSLYLATSDFLTHMALNFPPDNGSLFTFSMFFIVYLLTLNIGTIRWLLFLGVMGTIDGLNKALFLINDPAALAIFSPVFFYEKLKEKSSTFYKLVKAIVKKENIKLLFLSLVPLLVFITIYSAWEIFVQLKFSAPYWLRGLVLSRGESYISYTSFDDSSFTESIASQLFYLFISAIVMIKQLIDYTDLRIIFLAPIFLGLLFLTFAKRKFPVKKFILIIISSALLVFLLISIKDNYLKIHDIFPVEYIKDNWKTQTYVRIFLFIEIIALFIINFKYSALKLSFPILPYVVMLIILTKNSPFPRLHTHVVAWSVILLAFIIDWIMMNVNKYSIPRIKILLGPALLALFIYVYMMPKMVTMATQLNSGATTIQSQVRYLRWVDESIPENAVILAGGKSNLVILAEHVKRPIIYNSIYSAALLIKPNQIPGISPTDFSIIPELQNKDNFKRKRYLILEDDIYIWRGRLTGVIDNVFVISPKTLHPDDYSIKVYKYNPDLKKAIYELIFL